MQIIEVTDFGVRSAVIRLRHRRTPLQFVLYPMIHMAKPTFYAAVTARLERADVVVVEGVSGDRRRRSVLIGALTLSYRILRFNRRAGLVAQNIDYAALGVPVVRPDVTREEFTASWRRAPLTERLMLWCVLPIVVVMRLFGGTRTIWTHGMERYNEDVEKNAEEMPSGVEAAILTERDERLLAALYRLHEERGGESIEVAVVYGAGHVSAVVSGLRKRYGYRPHGAEWLTIADL